MEFPTRITAIVGPNGSGKSNIADAIRWVLGEQSMKYLRGKKGEDLIFGGGGDDSRTVSRLAKASVALVFDNLPDRQAGSKKAFPLEFDEVIISRRVYRDGINDYLLNGSQVRLKDIVELLSKVGLGASQHHIIAQGDADRILYASPKERKAMIEEALGLKIFELKKNEAERKLGATSENIKQVESLRREIQPHLKYLESQAQKMENASLLRKELENISKDYVSRELKTIETEERATIKNKEPLESRVKSLEEEIAKIQRAFSGGNEAEKFFAAEKKLDAEREAISHQRRVLEREIGKLEAENRGAGFSKTDALPKEKVKSFLMDILPELESASRSGTMDIIRNTIFSITQKIYGFLETLNGASSGAAASGGVELKKARELLDNLDKKEKEIASAKENLQADYGKKAARIQKEGASYREYTEELALARDNLRNFTAKKEKLDFIKKEFEIDFAEWTQKTKPAGEAVSELDRTAFRKKIERLKIRLEEAGGVDEGVFKEYEETKKRDEFLAKELDDLKNAEGQLKGVFEDLETKIAKDFESGLAKINKLFSAFFHEIFGGGNAEIKFLKPKKVKKTDEELLEAEWEGEVEEEEGLDIIVDIPRKRIKSLNMLSGGERALTSIALLFAMSTANPPPFLVLDETDAALDEANSAKYAAMLKELGKKTQLVVVTHNRETMKSADVLYGVTMGGDGVSKLLSIKLEEAENVLARKK